jgi:hypothetical protein
VPPKNKTPRGLKHGNAALSRLRLARRTSTQYANNSTTSSAAMVMAAVM